MVRASSSILRDQRPRTLCLAERLLFLRFQTDMDESACHERFRASSQLERLGQSFLGALVCEERLLRARGIPQVEIFGPIVMSSTRLSRERYNLCQLVHRRTLRLLFFSSTPPHIST